MRADKCTSCLTQLCQKRCQSIGKGLAMLAIASFSKHKAVQITSSWLHLLWKFAVSASQMLYIYYFEQKKNPKDHESRLREASCLKISRTASTCSLQDLMSPPRAPLTLIVSSFSSYIEYGCSFKIIQEEADKPNVLLKFVAFFGLLLEAAFCET